MLLSLILLLSAAADAGTVRHDLKIKIEPVQGVIEAEASITLPEYRARVVFYLNTGLSVSVLTDGAELKEEPGPSPLSAEYSLTLPKGRRTFRVKYSGTILPASAAGTEAQAGVPGETAGRIAPEGCGLFGSDSWYPRFEGELSSFRLETDLPEGYHCVSGGERASRSVRNGRSRSVWNAAEPVDEITLFCAGYRDYSAVRGGVALKAFLLKPDDALAEKHLEAAGRYLEMYSALIGPYPYGKFALVENFREADHGFSSLTLLGPKALRSPFTRNSFYPRAILRNWWDESVFLEPGTGDWREGLIRYLSDYLTAEERGKDREYRLTVLQEYSERTRTVEDLPLRGFSPRHPRAPEGTGYGKALMFYHMLRRSIGDEKFKAGLRDLFREYKFKHASFESLKKTFEKQTGEGKLENFFSQWLDRPGAPELALSNVRVTGGSAKGFDFEFTIAQRQNGPLYRIEAPVAIHLEGVSQPRTREVVLEKKEETFRYSSPVRPVRVELDPEFDVFRKVSPLEIPPALSALLNSGRPLIILPSAAPGYAYSEYMDLAAGLGAGDATDIRNDSEISELPKDRNIWVFGRENIFYPTIAARLRVIGAGLSAGRAVLDDREFPFAAGTFVFTARNPGDPDHSTGLILTGRHGKLGMLTTRLRQYEKYGYLVLDEDMAVLKAGNWGPKASPLSAVLSSSSLKPAYAPRTPLAAPAPVFQTGNMRVHISNLVPGPEGRGPGGPGLEKSASYIERSLRQYGLKPFFGGSYLQAWRDEGRILRNLAGMVEGSSRKHEYVIISAHYGHPSPDEDGPYPGTNGSAPGAALLLELAAHYSRLRPERTIIFAAFDGEKRDRLGSKYFVSSLDRTRLAAINANLDLDTIGRPGPGKILFLNADSSDKWREILRDAGLATGTEYETVRRTTDAGGQLSFIEAGVPGLQIFSGMNADRHKHTADKIDYPGMQKEAEFLKEIIDHLAGGSEMISRPVLVQPNRKSRQGTR